MYINIYITDEEHEFLKSLGEGSARQCIRRAMDDSEKPKGVPQNTTPIKEIKKRPVEKNNSDTLNELKKIPGIVSLEEVALKRNNPDACKECGQIKSAGRCINKNCKLKGKLQ